MISWAAAHRSGFSVPQGYPIYDKKEQLEKIDSGRLPGETIYAVFDMKGGGTGFLGITDKRIIIYDKTFM